MQLKNLEQQYEIRLKQMVLDHPYLLNLLRRLSQIHEHAYISAGVIRNWIWSMQHHQDYSFAGTEIDVIFYDPNETNAERSNVIVRQLIQSYPDHLWYVTNQATVHQCYQKDNGDGIEPLSSIHHALSLWPETATAVAIRLLDHNKLDMIIPFGLDDLFELKLRWNDRMVSRGVFEQRVRTKGFLERWPQLEIVN